MIFSWLSNLINWEAIYSRNICWVPYYVPVTIFDIIEQNHIAPHNLLIPNVMYMLPYLNLLRIPAFPFIPGKSRSSVDKEIKRNTHNQWIVSRKTSRKELTSSWYRQTIKSKQISKQENFSAEKKNKTDGDGENKISGRDWLAFGGATKIKYIHVLREMVIKQNKSGKLSRNILITNNFLYKVYLFGLYF